MELVIALAVLSGGGLLLHKAWQSHRAAAQARRLRTVAVAAARRQQADQRQRERAAQQQRQAAARNLQVALHQLPNSPDFRRAASIVQAAHDVPAAFRQRQFRRLRPLLVNHLAEQLRRGASAEAAAAGLADLVVALGVADYEADYIVTEARGRTTARATPSPARFEDQVQQWQAEHARRLETLRGLPLDAELKEQLLEQEETRFRDQLLAAGNPTAGTEPIQV